MSDHKRQPLTLQQLLQRDGKPIWITGIDVCGNRQGMNGAWHIARGAGGYDSRLFHTDTTKFTLDLFNKTWFAYANEPENLEETLYGVWNLPDVNPTEEDDAVVNCLVILKGVNTGRIRVEETEYRYGEWDISNAWDLLAWREIEPAPEAPSINMLQQIIARNDAATMGPWEWVKDRFHEGFSGIINANDTEILFPNHCNDGDDGAAWFEDFPNEADRELIAHAKTDGEFLIAEITRLNRRMRAAEADIKDMSESLPLGVACYYCDHYVPSGGDGECGDGCSFVWQGNKPWNTDVKKDN